MATIFEKAWGNYTSMLNFLMGATEASGWETKYGLFQPFDLASNLSYSKGKNNYNNFLLNNLSNFVSPTQNVNGNHPNDDKYTYPIKLENAYGNFLNEFSDYILKQADLSKPNDQKQYDQLKNEFKDNQAKFENYQVVIDDKWFAYAESNHIPEDQREDRRIIWERERKYSAELERLKNNIRLSNAKINAFIRLHTPKDIWPLINALDYFDDPNYQVLLPINPQYDDISKKSYWRQFRWQFPIVDLDEFLTVDEADTGIKNTFSTQTEDYKRIETKWSVSAKASWGIFSGGGSVQKSELEEICKKGDFEFEISFKRFANVEIYRDAWFQDVLFTTLGKQLTQYWGPNGLLAAIPYSLVIARGAKIVVKMSEEYRRKFESFISAGGSFGFGSFFSLGANYSKDEKYMNYNKTDQGFELIDNPNTIRVLGSCVKRFNWDVKDANDYYDIKSLKNFTKEQFKTAITNFNKDK